MSRKFECGIDEEVEEREKLLQELLQIETDEELCAFMIDRLRQVAEHTRSQRDHDRNRVAMSAFLNHRIGGRDMDEHHRLHYQAEHLKAEAADADAQLTDRFANLLEKWMEDKTISFAPASEKLPSIFSEEEER